jgi:hypothetical protein
LKSFCSQEQLGKNHILPRGCCEVELFNPFPENPMSQKFSNLAAQWQSVIDLDLDV